MRLTIIVDDKLMIIDGNNFNIDTTLIDPNIHAVQWYEDWGEIEYRKTKNGKPQNLIIDELSQFENVIATQSVENTTYQTANTVITPLT